MYSEPRITEQAQAREATLKPKRKLIKVGKVHVPECEWGGCHREASMSGMSYRRHCLPHHKMQRERRGRVARPREKEPPASEWGTAIIRRELDRKG